MSIQLALAPLTLLGISAAETVRLAEHHGFDFFGIRLLPSVHGGYHCALQDRPHEFREFKALLSDSSARLLEVELVRLQPGFHLESVMHMLDAACELGARTVLVTGEDSDAERLRDNYAVLADACHQRALTASLEPMPWTPISTVDAALDILGSAVPGGSGVLIDTLHFARVDEEVDVLSRVPEHFLHYWQVCDGGEHSSMPMAEIERQARQERQLPGTGVVPITDIWRRMPSDVPVSIEVPNPALRTRLGIDGFVEHLKAATLTQAPSDRRR